MIRGRFAPSPTGRMHLGNVFTALLAWLSAKSQGGQIVLRVEDLDPARSRPEYTAALLKDFRWLGLDWDERAQDQSARGAVYAEAIERLRAQGLIYPCFCSRDQLHAASAPHASDGRVIYDGRCRDLNVTEAMLRLPHSLRVRIPEETVAFTDGLQGPQSMDLRREWGDFIVRRADAAAAYQLAVVVDDAACGITEVVRGRDLLSSTPVQLWLYKALDLPAPRFYHVPLLLAPDGRRLSKRDRDLNLDQLAARWNPRRIVGLLAWKAGLTDRWEEASPRELLPCFDWSRGRREDIVLDSRIGREPSLDPVKYGREK